MTETTEKKRATALRASLILVSILLLLELSLQLMALYSWYIPRVSPGQTILCIADYPSSYPQMLQEKLDKAIPGQLRVVAVVNPHLTSKETLKVVDFYLKNQKPKVIYITLGKNEAAQYENMKKAIIWNNSFEWKLRSLELLRGVRSGDFGRVLRSAQFRTVVLPKAGEPSPETLRKETSTVSGSSTQTNRNIPPSDAIKNFMGDSLLPEPSAQPDKAFPDGAYVYSDILFDFKKDGTMSLGNFPLQWTAEQDRLKLVHPNHTLEFSWRIEGKELILISDSYPISMVLQKVFPGTNKQKSGRLLFKTARVWNELRSGSMDAAQRDIYAILKDYPDNPCLHALLARTYVGVDGRNSAENEIQVLGKFYEASPNQGTAEALFFSISERPYDEKRKYGRELLRKYPLSPLLWVMLSEYAAGAGDQNLSWAAKARALQLLPLFLERTRSSITGKRAPNTGPPLRTDRQAEKSQQNLPKARQMILSSARKREAFDDNLRILNYNCREEGVPLVLVLYPNNSLKNDYLRGFSRVNGANLLQNELGTQLDTVDTPETVKRNSELVSSVVMENIRSRFSSHRATPSKSNQDKSHYK